MGQPNEQQVCIVLEPDGDGVIVKWERPGREKKWSLANGIETLKGRAKRLRSGLTPIVDVYKDGNPARDYDTVIVPALRAVAKQGQGLYEYLFGQQAADNIKKYLEERERAQKPVSIVMRVNPQLKLHVPWGLMFSRPLVRDDVAISDEDLRRHFWSIKHRLATVLQWDLDELPAQRASKEDSDSILCHHVMEAAKVRLEEFYDSGRVHHRWESFLDRRKDGNRCLYFFCHSELAKAENKLSLSIHDET